MHLLQIKLFGPLRLARPGRPEEVLRAQNLSSLVAYLAVNLDRAVTREALAELLWPDADPESSRARLRTLLSSARDVLEPDGAEPGSVLLSTRTTVRLVGAAVGTDLSEFLAVSRKLSSDATLDPAELEHALSLAEGVLLEGMYDDWVLRERDRTELLQRRMVRALVHACAASGRLDRAIEIANELVAEDPLNEESHCLVMRLHLQAGRPAAALIQFESLQKTLQKELGVRPGDEALALEAEARSNRSVSQTTPPFPAVPAPRSPAPDRSVVSASEPASLSPGRRTVRPPLIALGLLLIGATVIIWTGFTSRNSGLPDRTRSVAGPKPVEPIWIHRYETEKDETDSDAASVVIDDQGNSYVGGFVKTAQNDVDYLTVKLSPEGKRLWRRRYNGTGNDVDRIVKVGLDGSRNVYVTGDSDNGVGNDTTRLSGLDVVTIKYDSDGNQLWQHRWNGEDNGEDRPTSIIVRDDCLYVLVTEGRGRVKGQNGWRATLLKYSVDGRLLWRRSPNLVAGESEVSVSLMGTAQGDIVLIANRTFTGLTGGDAGVTTTCYSADGDLMWQNQYGLANGVDDVAHVGFGHHSSVCVFAVGRGLPGTLDETKRGGLILRYRQTGQTERISGSTTEAERVWRIVHAEPAGADGLVMLGDAFDGRGQPCYRLILRDSSGITQWVRDLGRPATTPVSMGSSALCVDYRHDIYATTADVGSGTQPDELSFLTRKYDRAGNLLWSHTYRPGNGIHLPTAQRLRNEVFIVAGRSQGPKTSDMVVLRYPVGAR